MGSMLHPDIANIDPKNCSPEEMEKLLSDPLMRNLQYQLQHGVQDIKLETNKGEQKINNMLQRRLPRPRNQRRRCQSRRRHRHR